VSARIHFARLVSRRNLAHLTDEFVFSHDEPELRFRPGQFISVQVGVDALENPVLRSYSIASPPERRGELVFVLRLVEGGMGTKFFESLNPGDGVRFTGPMGFFVNELEHPGDVVYAATGTGIAPILPMIKETLERPQAQGDLSRVHLFWGLRNEHDLFWQDEIAALAARHPRFCERVYLSQPQGFCRLRGRITGPILELLPSLRAPTFYLCGNGKMIEEVKEALIARGVNRKRQIRTESFFD
jgi:ferredoxin-NADP reductase